MYLKNIPMRKHIICIALTILAFCTNAQEFKRFKVGVGSGLAILYSNNASAELFYAEPGYRITDALLVNLRLEVAFILSNNRNYENTMEGLRSFSVNGQYYFGSKNFRPFAGLGVGMFRIPTYDAQLTGAGISYGYANKPGFYTRMGFDLGHLNLSLDYNFVTPTIEEEIIMSGQVPIVKKTKVANGYLGFRIGFTLGGGRKSTSEAAPE
jgi:hypothetical protein